MSKSYTIGDLIALYYENEFSMIEDIPLPNFTAGHNRKMKKAFDIFDKNKPKAENHISMPRINKHISIRKRLLMAAVVIICLALVTGCVIAFISNSFCGTVYNDNTYVFAFDTSGCPASIEKEYELSVVPEGYELNDVIKSSSNILSVYKNSSNQNLYFTQSLKKEFNLHINTEGFVIEELVIDDCDGICVEYERETGNNSLIIWNSSEYIMQLYGNFTKQELIDLANSNEIAGF